MRKAATDLPEGDWPVTFDAVSLQQYLRFRALPPAEKLRAMEDLATLADRIGAQRRARGLPVVDPGSKKRPG